MKEVKVISIHKKDCDSVYRNVNGKVIGKRLPKLVGQCMLK
jgi:hypothetical protein